MNQARRPKRPSTSDAGSQLEESALSVSCVPDFGKYPEAVEAKHSKVKEHESDLSLYDTEQLMRNCQAAQRNLTETLNKLSAYRKTVANMLEKRRREAAKQRREGSEPKQVGPILKVEEFLDEE